MLSALRALCCKNIRRQLVVGVTLVHAVLMTLFVLDLVERQRSFLFNHSLARAKTLARSLAASSTPWVLTSNVAGLKEVVSAVAHYPDLRYIMFLDTRGRVLAHIEERWEGSYVADPKSLDFLAASPPHLVVVHADPETIDIAAPVVASDHLVGWARVGLDQKAVHQELKAVVRDGIFYAGVAILTGAMLALILARSLGSRMVNLSDTMDFIRRGRRDLRADERRDDELGQVARGLNQMLDALNEKEERLAALLESTAEGIVGLAPDGTVVFSNPAAQRMMGLGETRLSHSHIAELIAGEGRGILQSIAHGRGIHTDSERFLRADGSSFPVECWCFPMRPGLEPRGAVLAFLDISERLASETAVRRQRKLLQTIVDSVPAMIFVRDAESRFLLVNRAYADAYGMDVAALQQRNLSEVLDQETASRLREDDLSILDGRSAIVSREESVETAEGKRWYYAQRVPYLDENGERTGIIGIAVDISDRKSAEESLARQREELARSNAELERFAYIASHDLQEPLRMVASYVQLLARRYRGKLDDDADEFIGFAVDGATRMRQLINDLLTYSRVGTRGREFTKVNAEEVLAGVLADLSLAIEDTGAGIRHAPLPELFADAFQIHQLLQNLLANALKFRGEHAPDISIDCRQENGHWHFSIEDNGIGIPPEARERIFLVFQRLHGRDKYPGTGIGLAICKRIVERHGGRIWVETTESGMGTAFHFTLAIRGPT